MGELRGGSWEWNNGLWIIWKKKLVKEIYTSMGRKEMGKGRVIWGNEGDNKRFQAGGVRD